jgi:hypothetical protein
MAASNKVDKPNFKIDGIDIELKEKQFMDVDFEYYKIIKTKSKKNSHAFNNEMRAFRRI